MSQTEEKQTVKNAENQEPDSLIEEQNASELEQSIQEESNEEPSEFELLQQQLTEETNRHLRLRADYENFKRRTHLDREAADKYKAQSLLSNLLPVLDNFERAMQVESASEELKSLRKGLEMVFKTLLEATEKEGLQVIEAVGVSFDPNLHQAVMTETDDSTDVGTVLQELQKGYKYKDRVLRPSMVKVNE
ncbi:nucleotide exchange factor GrpE [Paenisporosarcina sp. TG-14]|uniref:nucleotide exchange factor GrpE n=1 Tax=Paenisporosarcina sp. TG-14 TaxID=1231057 RepID=UPI000303F371|nr:nucleotide exchange factor GrpE [Paenisporosarcina sp. TG-14]